MAREQKILQPEWKLNQDRSFLEKFLQMVSRRPLINGTDLRYVFVESVCYD